MSTSRRDYLLVRSKLGRLYEYDDLAREEAKKHGVDKCSTLKPMFKVQDNKLYVVVGICDGFGKIKPEYWALFDIITDQMVEFTKTTEKDFVIENGAEKQVLLPMKEELKCIAEKTLQYKEYFREDFKNFHTPIQQKVINVLGNEVTVDGEIININDYIFANTEEKIDDKLNELVRMVMCRKKELMDFYFDFLGTQIINEYKLYKSFDLKKLKLYAEILNTNYGQSNCYTDDFLGI